MEAIKKILRTPSALVLFLVAIVSLIGVIIKGETDKAIVRIPIDATSTAEARLTQLSGIFNLTQSAIAPSETSLPSQTNAETPTLTFTPTTTSNPTLQPAGSESTPVILFSDSFGSNANSWALGIRDGNLTRQNREITEGALQLDVDFHENAYAWVNAPNFQAENFYLSVDAEVVQYSAKSKIGVVITFRTNNQGNTAYAIVFSNDGTFALYWSNTVRENGEWQFLHQENSDAFQLTEGDVNKFGIRVLGQRFTAYANDIELYTFEDNNINNLGEVGIGIKGQSQKTAIVRFDNLIISK